MWLDVYQAQQVKQEQVRDCLRRAETRSWLREAGIDQRGWLMRQVCRPVCSLGRALVVLGQRLEDYARPAGAAAGVAPNQPASLRR